MAPTVQFWVNSYVDDSRVADICKITFEEENKKRNRDFRRPQEEMQATINKTFEQLSSRLFDRLEERLEQVLDGKVRLPNVELHAPSPNYVEQEAPLFHQASSKKPPRLSVQGIGSVPIGQLIDALKSINGHDTQENYRGTQETDDDQDDPEDSASYRRRCTPRKSTTTRNQRQSLAPSQIQEVPTADASLSMADPLYHNQVRDTRKGVWSRPIGASKPGVKVLVPANGKLSRLMDYRYYRIPDPEPYDGKYLRSRRVRSISALKSHMSDTKFSGNPPTLVFDFLDRYRDVCIGIDLSEIEAHQYLGDFLSGAAKELYNLITVADRSDTSVVGWCTKVNWLLSMFATDENIQNAVQKFQDMNQEENETESDYFARFMRQYNFCGNYLESAALRSTLINSLQPRLRHAVSRFINTKREADMADILQFVQDEGKAQRLLKEYLERGSRA